MAIKVDILKHSIVESTCTRTKPSKTDGRFWIFKIVESNGLRLTTSQKVHFRTTVNYVYMHTACCNDYICLLCFIVVLFFSRERALYCDIYTYRTLVHLSCNTTATGSLPYIVILTCLHDNMYDR